MASAGHVDKDGLLQKFQELGISSVLTIEHPEVFTMEEMMPHVQLVPGVVCKNLFLRDKKKKLWLFSGRHNLDVKLNDLAKKVGAPGGLRFADEAILTEKLGVGQGCVTPYALINDKGNDVRFILDSSVIQGGHERVFFHPITNSATTGISPDDFNKFFAAINHIPILVDFD